MTKIQLQEAFAMEQVTAEKLHVRHFVDSDWSAIMRIEESLTNPWTKDEVAHARRKRCAIAQVAECNGRVIGYSIRNVGVVGPSNRMIEVVRLAVLARCRKMGTGRALLGRMQDKMCTTRRDGIFCEVPDSELGIHMFLRAMGFKAVRILRRSEGDAYMFEWLAKND